MYFIIRCQRWLPLFFFFNDTATTEIYTLSLHDALPICTGAGHGRAVAGSAAVPQCPRHRSEEHTSELQSHLNLVCRLLLEKKKKIQTDVMSHVNVTLEPTRDTTPCLTTSILYPSPVCRY